MLYKYTQQGRKTLSSQKTAAKSKRRLLVTLAMVALIHAPQALVAWGTLIKQLPLWTSPRIEIVRSEQKTR